MNYTIQYLKEDLSNQITNYKIRYRWEIKASEVNYIIEMISTVDPRMQRLYINNQMVSGSNMNGLQKFYYSQLLDQNTLIEVIEIDNDYELLVNQKSFRNYLAPQIST